MSPKALWLILLKMLGIWLILEGLSIIPQLLSTIVALYDQTNNQIFSITAVIIISIAAYGFVIWNLLFKAELLIKILRLEKGFSEADLNFNIHRSTVLKITVIVIGGLIIIESLPQLCRNLFTFLQFNSFSTQNPLASLLVFYFVKFLIGFFLVANTRMLVNLIENLRTKS
jgi:hypothetical protein